MIMRFEFATANRILFGEGVFLEVGSHSAKLGKRVFLVTGKTPSRAAKLTDLLTAQGLACTSFSVPGEPTTTRIKAGLEQA